ncbi:WYL domain-containing transcriptional regulator [Spirosoma sp. SC4-14]|uniref:helix-turn-helix transcriptional regulator n=1 Tax=Spirosoma sp. SC4-14 TaxID=3128900 RepID=UPI0030D59795
MPQPTSSLAVIRHCLQSGQQPTYSQLRDLTGLSHKQVQRLLRQLKQEGLPIQEHRSGRERIFSLPTDRQHVQIPALDFDNSELRALAIAAKASRSVLAGTPHFEPLKRAFDKLLERARPVTYVFDLEEPLQEWHFDNSPTDLIALENFRALEAAMDERQSVRVNYHTAKTGTDSIGRKIDPYCFVKRGRAWLLIAWCHERQAIRNFGLTRISQVEPCPEDYFEIPGDFDPDTYFWASMGAINSGEVYTLRLLVEPEKARYFRERQYHSSQQIETERPDGRLVVSYELEGFEEVRAFCQSWGVGVTVLEPAELRVRLRQESEELLARYQND